MIQKRTAQEFIDRLDTHIAANVNIMDAEGIIIASRDSERIGSFHEAAYRLIRHRLQEERIDADGDLPMGARPGINLPIRIEEEIHGVLGVTGDPEKIRELAFALKSSMEMLIELERYKDRLFHRRNRKQLFMSRLLEEEPYRAGEVETLASQLGYSGDCTRVPLLLRIAEEETYEAERLLRENGLLAGEDLSFIAPDGTLLIFHRTTIHSTAALVSYRREMHDFARSLLDRLQAHLPGSYSGVSVGLPQERWEDYRSAYRQIRWLDSRVNEDSGVRFFLDHLELYLLSRTPREEYLAAGRVLTGLLGTRRIGANQRLSLLDTAAALRGANLSISEAASRLGLHRNTVTARMERLRDIYGIDLLHDPSGKELLLLLVVYRELLGEG